MQQSSDQFDLPLEHDTVKVTKADLVATANAIWLLQKRLLRLSKEPLPAKLDLPVMQVVGVLLKYGVEIVDVAGREYSEGLAVEVVSVEGAKIESDHATIVEMVRPIILINGDLAQLGQVTLLRVGHNPTTTEPL